MSITPIKTLKKHKMMKNEDYFKGKIKTASNDMSIFNTKEYVEYKDAVEAVDKARTNEAIDALESLKDLMRGTHPEYFEEKADELISIYKHGV